MLDKYTIKAARAPGGAARARTGAARGRPQAPAGGTRNPRLAAIRRIVAATSVGSQEHLTELLRREGYTVTQATLSRDLKRLGIGKAPSNDGGYTYILSEGEVKPGSDATYIQDFTRGFLSIEFSGNLGLMRTLPGHASSVASALDNLRIREVLGTIAGDDTVLVVARNGVVPARLTRAVSARIPGFAPRGPGFAPRGPGFAPTGPGFERRKD
jgi:transcriptional regulator of arginine metabolism